MYIRVFKELFKNYFVILAISTAGYINRIINDVVGRKLFFKLV